LGRENAGAKAVAGGELQSSRYPTQQLLIAAIRRGEERAMHELFVLYAPLLRDQAKRMGVPHGERDQLVDTVLDDIVIHLVEMAIPPRELTTYIVTSLRNRIRTRRRDAARERQIDENAYTEFSGSAERLIAECHSEYGIRASSPSDADEDIPLRSAIKKLADRSASELSQEELVLMIGVGRHIPLRDLAEHLGISHGAVRVRLSRLRERFLKLTAQYFSTLEADEKAEIARFLRRAEVRLDGLAIDADTNRHEAGSKHLPPQEQS
jgi:RNA polymerase sigma factor (sigma-70 family)